MAHTYICFDADTDMTPYQYMRGWKNNKNIPFDFDNAHDLNNLRSTSSEETIKNKLRERMAKSDLLIVLVGDKTKNLYRFVRWEIEIALDRELPIVAVYLNGSRKLDNSVCPPILKDKLVLHIPYKQAAIQWAMDNWKHEHSRHNRDNVVKPIILTDETYKQLGI